MADKCIFCRLLKRNTELAVRAEMPSPAEFAAYRAALIADLQGAGDHDTAHFAAHIEHAKTAIYQSMAIEAMFGDGAAVDLSQH